MIKSIRLLSLILLAAQTPGFTRVTESAPNITIGLESIRQTYHVSTGFEIDLVDADKAPVAIDLSVNDPARLFNALVAQRPAFAGVIARRHRRRI